jgi:glycosyltransferase involved in cell wall biosynthesis
VLGHDQTSSKTQRLENRCASNEFNTLNDCNAVYVSNAFNKLNVFNDLNSSLPISAVVLCHNEAANLPRCLAALRGCAEVVVVDDGSTDGSPRIAAECGARVVVHPFTSFADQRNWALGAAGLACDWVLHLDADEVAPPELLEEIRARLPGLPATAAGFVARQVILDEKWLRFSADYPVFVPRLVHRQGLRFAMRGHGDVLAGEPAPAVYFDAPLRHHNFSKGWAEWRERHLRYAVAEAARIQAGLAPVSLRALLARDRSARRAALRGLSYRLPARPLLRFVYAYVLRLGFLDGRPGLRFCRAMAAYERMIDAARRRPPGARAP